MPTIRPIRPADLEAYKALRLEAVRLHPEAFGASLEGEMAKTNQQWRERVESGARGEDQTIVVADNGAQLVGMVGVFRESGKSSHVGDVWGVYVQADYRGNDLGCALLQEAIRWASSKSDLRKLKLMVNANAMPARKLYLAKGFVEVGRLKDEMCVDGECYDLVMMELYL